MANFIKVKTEKDVRMLIKHNNRERDCSTNPDIDEERSKNYYSLIPKWIDNYELFQERKEKLYYRKNDNMVNALACIITAPKDLESSLHKEFFEQCFEFSAQLCGIGVFLNFRIAGVVYGRFFFGAEEFPDFFHCIA